MAKLFSKNILPEKPYAFQNQRYAAKDDGFNDGSSFRSKDSLVNDESILKETKPSIMN